MSFAVYNVAASLAVVLAAAYTYHNLQRYHEHVLGKRLQGRWNVFVHTFLALVLLTETTYATRTVFGSVYPVFDFLLFLTVLFGVAFVITVYRLYHAIKL